MTIINPNSISGISSITALNSTAAINLFKADGTSANVIAGVVTATTFKGALEVTSASFSSNIDANGDLDVDGQTHLDNVSIAGVTTASDNISIVKSSGPILELTTNTNAADSSLRLHEGTAGSTSNGGGMYYSGANNKLYITCGTTLTTERITIDRDTGNVGINSTIPSQKLDVMDGTIHVHPAGKTGLALNGIAGQDVGVVRWSTGSNDHAIIIRGSSNDDGSTITAGNTMEFREYGVFSFKTGNNSGTMAERLRIKTGGEAHFYGNQTNTPEGDFGFRWDRNTYANLQLTNTNNTSVNAGARVTLKTNVGTFTGTYYNNGGFYLVNSANGYFNYYSNSVLRVNIDTNGNFTLNPDTANPLSTSNGQVGKRFGIKSTQNNIVIGETTTSGNSGLILESRVTGRSGNARCSQVDLGNGFIKFYTAASGADVTEKLRIYDDGRIAVNQPTGTGAANTGKVHIKSSASNIGQLYLEQNNATDGFILNQDGPNGGHLKFIRNISGTQTVNVLFRSDRGICFNGDTAAANALDDYEEGTATFALHIGGSEPSGISYTYNTAPYVKVGRMVYCAISMFATSIPADTGSIDIQGLPFTDGGGGGYREPAFVAANHGGVSTTVVITGALHGNNTKIRIRKNGNQELDGSDIGGTFWMHGHITYMST